jgi:ferredoxin
VLRRIIKIDEEKCDGCGLCVDACHEGAIGVTDGRAKLLREDYCDGLGNCLPACPTGAITFEEREAAAFNEAEVTAAVRARNAEQALLPCGCPGSNAHAIRREPPPASNPEPVASRLGQWPVQIKLVPVNAPYFENAGLLVSADCGAYAYGNFHNEFMRDNVTLIGCPKLDNGDYSEKLAKIISANNIKAVTVVRMEVPCCGGIENAVRTALEHSGKTLPWNIVTLSTEGKILAGRA